MKGPKRVEQAFWTGDLGNSPALQHEDTTVLRQGAASRPAEAIAALEAHIASTFGGQGLIHVTFETASRLVAAGVVEVSDGSLVTKLGTPVVAGIGYPGTGPAGEAISDDQSWAYITPPVFGFRSPVNTSSNRPGDLLDRRTNDLYAIAEQTYLLGFDPCGVAA